MEEQLHVQAPVTEFVETEVALLLQFALLVQVVQQLG
jgi:hypothetical protein